MGRVATVSVAAARFRLLAEDVAPVQTCPRRGPLGAAEGAELAVPANQ